MGTLRFTYLNSHGHARMVGIGNKAVTSRTATDSHHSAPQRHVNSSGHRQTTIPNGISTQSLGTMPLLHPSGISC